MSAETDTLIPVREVLRLTGIRSRTTIWHKVREDDFPAPIQVGANSVRWRESEVANWIESRPRVNYVRGKTAA